MANLKLVECDRCWAITHKDNEVAHERWHVALDRALAFAPLRPALEHQIACGCRLAEDRGDGKAHGTIPCPYHLQHGPPDIDD